MSLPVPTVGVATAPAWASLLDSCLSIIDSHSHVPGSGVPITPSAMSITSSIPMQGNGLTSTGSIAFIPSVQSSSNLLYESGVDLHYIDGNGNDVRLTASGSVNATSSGISSGTASASFSAGVLIVNSATSTPANIQAGSILLGNNVASSNFLTLSPPSAMGANIAQTLPTIPAATSFMQMDTSGVMSASVPVTSGITGSNIASQTIAQGNLAIRSVGLSEPAGGVGQSVSSTTFSTTSTSPVNVHGNSFVNLSITLVTTGRPVIVSLQPILSGSNQSYVGATGVSTGSGSQTSLIIFNEASAGNLAHLPVNLLNNGNTSGQQAIQIPPAAFSLMYFPSAGTYTYTVLAQASSSTTVNVNYCQLIAYEI